MSQKIESLADEASRRLRALIKESAPKIEEALVAAAEEAETQDAEAKFSIGFLVALNLDKGKADYTLGWSQKYRLTCESEIPNPSQLELPSGTSVTIVTGDQSVTIGGEGGMALERKGGVA